VLSFGNSRAFRLAVLLALSWAGSPASAQSMPDIGFLGVGRGSPIEDVQKHPPVGPIQPVRRRDVIRNAQSAIR
jgi:hypothetical protein